MTVYESKNPEVNREFSEAIITDDIIVADGYLKKKPAFKNINMILTYEEDKMDWNAAMKYAKTSTDYGFSDWRLPTPEEMFEIIKQFGKKMHLYSTSFWTSKENEKEKQYAYGVDKFSISNRYPKDYKEAFILVR